MIAAVQGDNTISLNFIPAPKQQGWKQTAPSTGTYNVTITSAGEDVTGKDFGNFPLPNLGSISGMKFNDLNGNGIRDSGESGLANWTIVLTKTDGSNETTISNLDGTYIFSNLTPGNYTVGEDGVKSYNSTKLAMKK